MDDIKDALIRLLVIIFILAGGLTILANIFNVVFEAICWVVFIDNAETGLSFYSETLVKGIVEAVIVGIAASLGISKKNPFISIVSILVGFVVCVCIYFIKQYILWILLGLGIIFAIIITVLIISFVKNKKENNKKEKKI